MKIKDGYVVRKVAGSYVVIKQGGDADFRQMITVNESGALIWDCINQGLDEDAIAERIVQEYDVDFDTAVLDTKNFILRMKEADVLE